MQFLERFSESRTVFRDVNALSCNHISQKNKSLLTEEQKLEFFHDMALGAFCVEVLTYFQIFSCFSTMVI